MVMTLPNPYTLGSGIFDVVALLSNEDKVSVLLYAMELLPVDTKYVSCTLMQHVPY
jgi:hypothetical protein